MDNLFDRLTETHPDATAVTLLSTPTEYQQMATDAFLAPVEMTQVRSHHNDPTCPEDSPSVSLFFSKD